MPLEPPAGTVDCPVLRRLLAPLAPLTRLGPLLSRTPTTPPPLVQPHWLFKTMVSGVGPMGAGTMLDRG